MKTPATLAATIAAVFFIGCDGGIEPRPEPGETGFSGEIVFQGEWDTTIVRTHLVVFKDPLLASGDFFPPNLVYVSEEIPRGTTRFEFRSNEDALQETMRLDAGTYAYVAVAQSAAEILSLQREDWFVVGVYSESDGSAKPLVIGEGETLEGVDVFCDFDNPPPQPPGGEAR